MVQLRLVKPAAPTLPIALTYVNRMGDTYYLHEGKTKTGKPRLFFAKAIREGALAEMPDGFEVSESINGVVSVKRKTPGAVSVPDEDVTVVQSAIGRHAHLRGYMVRAQGNAIVVFEPHPRPDELRGLFDRMGYLGQPDRFIEGRMKQAQYAPVMKFEREGDGYLVRRMTYRGEGGWSWPLKQGKLVDLAKMVGKIGTEAFYELM
jgi:hypothetical protein